jgi:hypothetical protein
MIYICYYYRTDSFNENLETNINSNYKALEILFSLSKRDDDTLS